MYFELDSNLTEKQRVLKETVHEFAKGVIRPASLAINQMANIEEIIKTDSIWWEARKKTREMGYHLAGLPKVLGGFELGPLELHILLEELGWGSPALGTSTFLDSFISMMVLTYHPENKRLINEIVTPFIKDKNARITGCFAATEPDHGSDVLFCFRKSFHDSKLVFDTRATLRGDEWIINGQKGAWVSNGPVASHAFTPVTICNDKGIEGGGFAIVPLDSQGVTRGKFTSLLGFDEFPQCEIFFKDVRIPKDYMLVGPDLFETVFDKILSMAGGTLGATSTGLARAAFEEALEYSKHRVQGGKLIADHQVIKLKLFDMFTNVEAARTFSRAAMKYCLTATNSIPLEYSAAAKIFCTQVAFKVAHEALQIHGAYGLTKESLVGKLFKDARVLLIADGCTEVLSQRGAYIIVENYKSLE